MSVARQLVCRTACLIIALSVTGVVFGSQGDRSTYYRQCVRNCHQTNCTTDVESFYKHQPISEKLLMWSCRDDCHYRCMWPTIKNFNRRGLKIPQFYGKWPFVRVLGFQEPASVLFSILNGLCHVYMLKTFTDRVPPHAPLFFLWIGCCVVSINAWIWSTVFHSRDTIVTEKLDYFSALACVQYMLAGALIRILRRRPPWLLKSLLTLMFVFFCWHVYYMAFVHFDYGYNMKVNITSGVLNSVLWLSWCYGVRREQPYVWKAAVVTACTDLLLLLELADFPPVFWTFDAHSLWHAGTVFLPVLWYSFSIEDSLYLLEEEKTIPFRIKRE